MKPVILSIFGVIATVCILYVAGLNAYTTANTVDKDKDTGTYKANIASSILSFVVILPVLVGFTYKFFKTECTDI